MAEEPQSGAGTRTCIHCGTPFSTGGRKHTEFCCNGCEYVYGLIKTEGLDHYYELRDRRIRPIQSAAMHKRDYSWLEQAVVRAEQSADAGLPAEMLLDLSGISCVGCVWLIEKVFRDHPGAIRIEINVEYGQVLIQWRPGIFNPVDFAREVQRFGYLLGPAGERPQSESRNLLGRLGVCAALALNTMLFSLPRYLGMEADFALAPLFELLCLTFATISLLVGGSYFIVRGFRGLSHGILHIDFPIALGVIVAWSGSMLGWWIGDVRFLYFDFVSIFIFLMLGGRWLQERSLEKNRHALLSRNHAPDRVCIIGDDLTEERMEPLDSLREGMRIRVLPGEVVPVLSELDSNAASLSLEWINGESAMSQFYRDQLIPSGALNIGVEPILLRARQGWTQSLLHKLLSAHPTATRDRKGERFLRNYLITVIAVALLGGGWWAFVLGDPVGAMQVIISILVVSCPCAIGVALPLAQEWAILLLREAGLFVRSPLLFNELENIRTIVFDKTGTLTLEAPELEDPAQIEHLAADARAVLLEMTRVSLHPVSRALYTAALARRPKRQPAAVLQVEEHVGFGLTASIGSDRWSLGRPGWQAAASNAPAPSANPAEHAPTVGTEFRLNGRLLAQFSFRESVRDDARELLATLQRRYPVYILSGDRREKVRRMASQLGIPAHHAHGELDPAQKAALVQQLGGSSVFFIGDGANDALAFAAAGVRATPATPHGLLQDKADFFFTGRSLQCFLDLFHIRSLRKSAHFQVIAFALLYNAIAVAISLAGLMHPLLAAILMPLSSIATMALVALKIAGGRPLDFGIRQPAV